MTVMTFQEAAEWFEKVAAEVEAAKSEMAFEAATIIEKEAKAELGVYQAAIGKYPAWAPLSEYTKEQRVRMGFPADEPLLVTGKLRDSIHVVPHEDGSASVGTDLEYAPYLENGTDRIPPRPFLGRAAFVKEDEILEMQSDILRRILGG